MASSPTYLVQGSTLLWYLEDTVGGPKVFEPFLKAYYTKFAHTSIDSDQFKAFFLSHFGSLAAVASIDWDLWLYSPGLPPYKPDYDTSLAKAAWSLALAWQQWQHTPGGRQSPG